MNTECKERSWCIHEMRWKTLHVNVNCERVKWNMNVKRERETWEMKCERDIWTCNMMATLGFHRKWSQIRDFQQWDLEERQEIKRLRRNSSDRMNNFTSLPPMKDSDANYPHSSRQVRSYSVLVVAPPSVYLSLCLFVCLSVCLSISVAVSIYLCISIP